MELCFKNIEFLSDHTAVYPQPAQLLFRGRKTKLLGQLLEVASEITKTPFPECCILEDPLEGGHADDESVVIKREFSECGIHVLLPQSVRRKEDHKVQSQKDDLAEMVELTEKYYNFPELKKRGVIVEWFMVPYLRTVRELGELRAYFIAGRLRYIMHTPWCRLQTARGMGQGMIMLWDIAVGITPLDCLR